MFIFILLLTLFIWGFIVEPNLLSVKKYKTDFLNGKKIVFVSDWHIGKFERHRLQKIVKKINCLKPDFILSGGDFIKSHSGKCSLPIEEQAKELQKLNAPFITVLGNHDIIYDKFTVKNKLEKYGIKVLDNSCIKLEDFYIAGVGNKTVMPTEIETALEHAEGKKILISHTPDIYYDVKEDVELILAGHVHGGQVRIPFWGAILVPSKYGNKFSCGDFNETQNRMIVTKGLGTSILGVRFNDIPEIVVLE